MARACASTTDVRKAKQPLGTRATSANLPSGTQCKTHENCCVRQRRATTQMMAKKRAKKSDSKPKGRAQKRLARYLVGHPEMREGALARHPGVQKDIAKGAKVSHTTVSNHFLELLFAAKKKRKTNQAVAVSELQERVRSQQRMIEQMQIQKTDDCFHTSHQQLQTHLVQLHMQTQLMQLHMQTQMPDPDRWMVMRQVKLQQLRARMTQVQLWMRLRHCEPSIPQPISGLDSSVMLETLIDATGEASRHLSLRAEHLPHEEYTAELDRESNVISDAMLADTAWVRVPVTELPRFRRWKTVGLSARALALIEHRCARRSQPEIEEKMRVTGIPFAGRQLTYGEAVGPFKWLASGERDATVRSLVSGKEGQLFRGLFEEA